MPVTVCDMEGDVAKVSGIVCDGSSLRFRSRSVGGGGGEFYPYAIQN